MKTQMRINKSRHDRALQPGERAYRKLPYTARLPKHLFNEPSTGPFEVVEQRRSGSAVLRNIATGELLDGGANIPMDQILVGPVRARIELEEDDEVRGFPQMLREAEEKNSGKDSTGRGGFKTGPKLGWGPLSGARSSRIKATLKDQRQKC